MSNDQSQDTLNSGNTSQRVQQAEVMNRTSGLDILFWIVSVILLLGAMLTNQYLPQYWQIASDVWIRVGVIVTCVLLACGLLYTTHQGKAFVRLLQDAQVELRRITWPTKQDTISTSWQVLIVVLVASLILWGFDTILGILIKFIIG